MILSRERFGRDAQEKMMEGVTILADAVATTLGPKGRNVAISRVSPNGEPYERVVVHDGVTVAKAIALEDEEANLGAHFLKEAAQKQVDEVGDGTTVSIVLARAILQGIKTLNASGVNPMDLRAGLEEKTEQIVSSIKSVSTPISGLKELTQIAIVSAQNDELGRLVAETVFDMGTDGLVAVEESQQQMTTVEKQDGMQLDKGYAHFQFQTNPDRLEAVIDDPYILVTDMTLATLVPLKDILTKIAEGNRKIVIIAPSFETDALRALLKNKYDGVLLPLPIPAPSFGIQQKGVLQDIATYVGARFITEDAGMKFEGVQLEDLGHADYVTATKSETIIVGGQGDKEQIEDRIASLRAEGQTDITEFDQEMLQSRIAKMTTGVAVIKSGGTTQVEMHNRYEQIKDAVAASKAALESGVVPGGEVVYLMAREQMKDDKSFAYRILYDALYVPFQKLLTNAGLNDGQYYERLQGKAATYGVDVMKQEVADMVKKGIVDPAAVPMSAIRSAVSVAIQIATTDVTVVQYAKKGIE